MYSEILSAKRSKISDTALLIICIALVFLLEGVAVAMRNTARVPVMIFQAGFIAFIIAFCIWYYKKRLLSMRYTLITDKTDLLGELEEKPEAFGECADGTLLVENLMNPPGTFIAVIQPTEMKAFYRSGELFEKPKHSIVLNATMYSKKTACTLLFEQEGSTFVLRFHPSHELEAAIKEYVDNAQ